MGTRKLKTKKNRGNFIVSEKDGMVILDESHNFPKELPFSDFSELGKMTTVSLRKEIRNKGYVVEMYKALWLKLDSMDLESEEADLVRDLADPFWCTLTPAEMEELEQFFTENERRATDD